MKNRADLLFFYTEFLGFAKFEQLSILFQTSIDIEDYLAKRDSKEVNLVKLMLFKHYLMQEAVRQKLLTKDQAEHLMQKKAWEVKTHQPPFSLKSIDVALIQPTFLKDLLVHLHRNKKFSLNEFRSLVSGYLSLPQNYLNIIKSLYNSKKQPEIHISQVEYATETLLKYEINCVCGNFLLFEIEKNSQIRMYCGQCRKLVLDVKKTPQVQTDKTLDNVAPDIAHKANIETRKFAHYKLLRKLGEGACGKVYLAKDTESEEQVALKVLTQVDTSSNQNIEYFHREIEMLSKLNHPNIVALKNCGIFEEKPYLVMEYVEGLNLLQVIEKNRVIPPRHAAKIFIALLEALEYAQQQKFVHRDIKPANIIINDKGVKLIDLGLAKVLETSLGLTKTGQIIGTPYYIAPEQVQNIKGIDHRADIYSLGASLFHSLCGTPPFEEHSKTTMKLLWNKLKDNYIRLQEYMPDLPPQITQIVAKSMTLDREKRYLSATDMKNDLVKFYQSQSKQS